MRQNVYESIVRRLHCLRSAQNEPVAYKNLEQETLVAIRAWLAQLRIDCKGNWTLQHNVADSIAASETTAGDEGVSEPALQPQDSLITSETYGSVSLLPALEMQSSSFKLQLGRLETWVPSTTLSSKTLDAQKEDVLYSWDPQQLEFRMTLLHWAAYTNRPQLVRFLVKECDASVEDLTTAVVIGLPKGCEGEGDATLRNPCCVCGEWTPLMLAAVQDHVTVVACLLELGASVSARDASGFTALAHATSSNSLQSMLVLLKHGAPTANVDGRASTLHDMAIQLNSWDVYQLASYVSQARAPEVSNSSSTCIPRDPVPLASRSGARRRKFTEDRIKDCEPQSISQTEIPKRFVLATYIMALWNTIRSTKCYCSNFTLPEDWELTALPWITIINVTLVTLSFWFEIPKLLYNASIVWRSAASTTSYVVLPGLWMLLIVLFKFPTEKGVLTQQYTIGKTDIEVLQTELENPDNTVYLSQRERPWVPTTPGSIRSKRKEFLRKAHQIRVQLDASRLCFACYALQPLRTFHCKYCQRCIRGFDHHCFWLRRCIGAENHRLFVLFVVLACLIQNVHLVLIFYTILGFVNNNFSVPTFHLRYFQFVPISWPFCTLLSLIIHVLSVYWIHRLLWTQLVNITRNLTTYEQLRGACYEHFWEVILQYSVAENSVQDVSRYRNPFDKGVVANCQEFYCSMPRAESVDFYALKEEMREKLWKETQDKLSFNPPRSRLWLTGCCRRKN